MTQEDPPEHLAWAAVTVLGMSQGDEGQGSAARQPHSMAVATGCKAFVVVQIQWMWHRRAMSNLRPPRNSDFCKFGN